MNEKLILEKLEDHDEQLAFIRENMVLRQDLEKYAAKEDLHELENRLMTALDSQMVILQRLDQERVFTNTRLDRIEQTLADHLVYHRAVQ